MTAELADYVLGVFGLHFALGINDGVEGKSLHIVVVSVDKELAHGNFRIGGKLVELLELLEAKELVVLGESCVAGDHVGTGFLRSLGIGECGSYDLHNFLKRLTALLSAFSFLHHCFLGTCAETGGETESQNTDFFHF